MRRYNIVELTKNSLVSNLTETCRAWAYLQELVKESKLEINEAKKWSVFLTDFTYVDYRGDEVTTQDIEGFLNFIYKYSFEKKEKPEDKR